MWIVMTVEYINTHSYIQTDRQIQSRTTDTVIETTSGNTSTLYLLL